MNANPTPYALGSEEREALWFSGVLVTRKATVEQTGESSFSCRSWFPEGRLRRFTSIRRTTSRSIS
jgi:hypothetical protein